MLSNPLVQPTSGAEILAIRQNDERRSRLSGRTLGGNVLKTGLMLFAVIAVVLFVISFWVSFLIGIGMFSRGMGEVPRSTFDDVLDVVEPILAFPFDLDRPAHGPPRAGGRILNSLLWAGVLTFAVLTSVTVAMKRLMFGAPRLLGIAFAFSVSVLPLFVFGEHHGFWETFLALLLYLAPAAVILAVLVVSWRWEWIGAVLFTALGVLLGVWYVVVTGRRAPWDDYLAISGPVLLTGVLFMINWHYKSALRARP